MLLLHFDEIEQSTASGAQPVSGTPERCRAWGTLKNLRAMKTYKKINMHVFPKTFIVVMMHNCKAIF